MLLGGDDAHILLVCDVPAAHRLEMRRFKLAVDEAAKGFQPLGQGYQCHLGCAGSLTEHAFAEETVADVHAIESAHQRALLVPYLYGCG